MLKVNDNLNILWIGLFLFILSISAPWFNLTVSSHDFVKTYVASLGISSLMLLSFYFKLKNTTVDLKINYIKASLLLLMFFGFFSATWSTNIDFTINKGLMWLIATFSFLLALNISLIHTNLIKIAWSLVISAGAIAFIGICQYYFDPFSLTQAVSPASTFGNKNMAIQPLVLILPLSLFLLLSKDTQGLKIWSLLFIISLIIAYIIFSKSRAAWLSCSIEITIILFYFLINRATLLPHLNWNRNKLNATVFASLLTLILINIMPTGESGQLSFVSPITGPQSIIETITTTGLDSDTGSIERFQIWQTAINMINDAPFIGTGLGSYSHNLANEGYASWNINNTIRAHNDLLELTVELGLTGIILFAFVLISIIHGIIKLLGKTNGELHLFYFLVFVSLAGSFVNMQFSFPYQLAFPLLLFGLYTGLIAKHFDTIFKPLINIKFSIALIYKKITFAGFCLILTILFYFTFFFWIQLYDQLDELNISGDFEEIHIVETPTYHIGIPYILSNLGGQYFNKGNYSNSQLIDSQLLKLWPNHLDVLYRAAYAQHKLGKNSKALIMANRLKKLEPEGLYNGYLVEMFIHQDEGQINKLELTFNQLLEKPEELLNLNDDTYRLMIFFTLASSNLSKHAPFLYQKFVENHGYSCEVENNIAIHYFNNEDFIQASEHVGNTITYSINSGKEQNCLNPDLIRLLQEKGL
jgi:O-antigen ligase/tetratricopeptide (TPR) repeat protein